MIYSRRKCATLLALVLALVTLCSMHRHHRATLVRSAFPRSVSGVDHDFEELDDEAVIERINHNNPSWIAGINENFVGMTVRDARNSVFKGSIQSEEEEEEDEFEDEMFLNATESGSVAPTRRSRTMRRSISSESDDDAGSDDSDVCNQVNCGTLSCCNGVCYNGQQYTCTNGQLCPSGMKACGRTCYDSRRYHCINGGLQYGSDPTVEPTPTPTPTPTETAPESTTASSSSSSSSSLPTNFDSRTKWPTCMSKIDSQGGCGGCWAFSAAQVLADRICIATNGTTKVDLSPQYQLNCNTYNMGCRGGYMSKTWTFLSQTGTTTEACTPYVSASKTGKRACASQCTGKGSFVRYRANGSTIKRFSNKDLKAVMRDIMNYGPIHASYYVYSDFYYYKSGVYTHTYGSLQAGHAIKIVGWGTDTVSGLPYWIVANSWGAKWGMNGYFWIKRGSNEANIENYLYSARPL